MLKVPKELPEWFILANSKAMFTAKDLAELFGVTPPTIRNYVKRGLFPEGIQATCTTSKTTVYGDPKNSPFHWSKQVVLEEISKLKEL